MKKPLLNDIIEYKRDLLQKERAIPLSKRFEESFHVIAEIKRHSPSRGPIKKINDPAALAKTYEQGGASMISVLTDQKFFHGSLEDLKKVSSAVSIPVLRKDFIMNPKQIAEAIKAGASSILLIVSVLGQSLKEMVRLCNALEIEPLVEVHDEDELKMALESECRMIGVNNRNLKDMEISLETSERLANLFPKGIIKIAESGMLTLDDVKRMKDAGYNAVLIGEALICHPDPAEFIRQARAL